MCSRTLRTTSPVRQNEVGDSSFDHLVGHLTQIIDGQDFDDSLAWSHRLGLGTKGVRGIRASLAEPEVVLPRLRTKDQAMEIESTTFGTITIDGKTYEHDVVIRLSGDVVKRKKKLSKKYYGTSHMLSKDEAKFVFEKGCEQLIVGSGQIGNVRLSPEAESYFARKDCKVLLQRTPEAIQVFNRSRAKKIGLFHVTC
jgi:hypothetical protein